jgi:hypothetical protein
MLNIQTELIEGPKSTRELGIDVTDATELVEAGIVTIDPDMFPGEYVPGNPMILRLVGDDRPWPGWKKWNL